MNLAELSRMQSTKSRMDKKRHDQAQNKINSAFEFLHQAFEVTGQQRETLFMQCCDNLGIALEKHRTNPDIYLGLAYVHLLLGERLQAINYLDEAERLSPDHPDLPTFKAKLKASEEPRSTPTPALQTSTLESPIYNEDEWDRLYSQVEDQMESIKLKIMPLMSQLAPSGDKETLTTLKKTFEKWEATQLDLQEKLKTLQTEWDIQELEMGMQFLSQFLKQNQNCIQISQKMYGVRSQIHTLTGQVREAKRHLETQSNLDKTEVHNKVETFLDQCDQLADALDVIEESGHSISELESHYQKLITILESYQDHVDEL